VCSISAVFLLCFSLFHSEFCHFVIQTVRFGTSETCADRGLSVACCFAAQHGDVQSLLEYRHAGQLRRFSVQADGLRWAYRQAESADGNGGTTTPVLLLHGIGSSSYSYRNLMRLLANDGFTCFAPDWPGHGSSDKVSFSHLAHPTVARCACVCSVHVMEALRWSSFCKPKSINACDWNVWGSVQPTIRTTAVEVGRYDCACMCLLRI
jgi:alpha/beta hydrolase fold